MLIKMKRNEKLADVNSAEVENMQAYGWEIVDHEPQAAQNEVPSLSDLVDDRALDGLSSIGVSTVADFLAADRDDLIALPYVTAKTIRKVHEACA